MRAIDLLFRASTFGVEAHGRTTLARPPAELATVEIPAPPSPLTTFSVGDAARVVDEGYDAATAWLDGHHGDWRRPSPDRRGAAAGVDRTCHRYHRPPWRRANGGPRAAPWSSTSPKRHWLFDRPKPPRDWRWVVGGIGKLLIVVGLLMFAFVAYQLWGTGIYTAQAQNELDDQFDQAAVAVPPTITEVPTVDLDHRPGDHEQLAPGAHRRVDHRRRRARRRRPLCRRPPARRPCRSRSTHRRSAIRWCACRSRRSASTTWWSRASASTS